MLIEILLFLFLGIAFGILTGLIPGIHINLVGVFLISLAASFLSFLNPIYFVVFIVAMAITHTFVDFIPSIFLGCPDTDTELSILPGHDLLKKGRGYEAITLTTYGSLAAIFILILLAFPVANLLERFYDFLKILIPGLLILISFFLISSEKKMKNALVAFLLTGLLGSILLIGDLGVKEPLLPLLTGLFGGSMLIISIRDKISIPKQKISKTKTKLFKPLLGATIASPLCSFLPGLGSGQAAIIGNSISNLFSRNKNVEVDKKGFLVLLGATNTLVMGFSFIALYAIARTRTGATVALQEIIGILSKEILILSLAVILISGIASFFITIKLAKFFSTKIANINYTLLCELTLIVLVVIVFLVSGFLGVLVLAASTATGIYCISLGVRRTNMMGCLLIPVIIFYLI